MIGTNIRGLRHLFRVCDNTIKKALIRCGEHGYDICEVIKTSADSKFGERLFIFNVWYNHTNYNFPTIEKEYSDLHEQISYDHQKVLELRLGDFSGFDGNFNDIVLLPETFDKDYAAFLSENSKMINRLSRKYGMNAHGVISKRLYIYTDGSKNFFQWATDLYFKVRDCSMSTIRSILVWNECYNQLTKNLSKGTITAYTTEQEVNDLLVELSTLRNAKRVNDAINSFNTAQKKLLKKNELSDADKETLARFAKLSDVKRNNFIRKVSTINDFQELMRQMRHVTSTHFNWSKESFMDFLRNVEGLNYEVIYENDAVTLIKVGDYETVKQLGKTTNWCISKNKSYWNNYVESHFGETTQYMIFDFSKEEDDKLSIVGFTTAHNKGITHAHNFVNDTLMEKDSNISLMMESYLSKFNKTSNIYDVLRSCNIDINMVVQYDKPRYTWNYEGFMKYLYECVNEENVDIIMHKGNKLVLSVCDENIRYFFSDAYYDTICDNDWERQHILFADFSINQYDPSKLTYCIVYDGLGDEADSCGTMFDENSNAIQASFNMKLVEYGLPYDIIRRPNDITKRAREAFISFNSKALKELIKEDENCFYNALHDSFCTEDLCSYITESIIQYLSFDYLDMIYDGKHTLSDYLNCDGVGMIVHGLANFLIAIGRNRRMNGTLNKPSDKDIEKFYAQTLDSRSEVQYVGAYLALKKIITEEVGDDKDYARIYAKTLKSLRHASIRGSLFKEIVYMMLGNINMEHRTPNTIVLMDYFMECGDQEMIDTVSNLAEKYDWVKDIYNYYVGVSAPKETLVTYTTTTTSSTEPVTIGTINDYIFDTL